MIRRTVWLAGIVFVLALQGVIAAEDQEESQQPPIMKPALIVIDIQNVWLPFMATADKDSAPAKINEAITLFRESKNPVIVVYHTDPKLGPPPGTDPFKFPDWVAIEDSDPVIVKNYPSSFQKTALDSVLKEKGVNAVFLCGLSATGCVLATYFGAGERDYVPFMVSGALISPKTEYTRTIEEILSSVGTQELATLLKGQYRLQNQ